MTAVALMCCLLPSIVAAMGPPGKQYLVTTGFSSKAVFFDVGQGGDVSPIKEQEVDPNLSFAALDAATGNVYAVHEVDSYPGLNRKQGAVSRWTLEKDIVDGGPILRRHEVLGTNGSSPTHVVAGPPGFVQVSNYGGGSFTSFETDPGSGRLLKRAYFESYDAGGDGAAARAHQTVVHGKFLYVVDLGSDRIMHYKESNGRIVKAHPESTDTPKGYGPRHMTVDGRTSTAYVAYELQTKVGVFRLNEESGALTPEGEVETVPPRYVTNGPQYASEISIHPDGGFLYVSNRGTGAIVVYKIDEETGSLTRIQIKNTIGKWPRHFAFVRNRSSGGFILLVAQERDNILEVYDVDAESGQLLGPRQRVNSVNKPSCVLTLP